MRKKGKEIFQDKCSRLNQRLSEFIIEIEEIRRGINRTSDQDKTERVVYLFLDEHLKALLADILILKDVIFEIEQCNYDSSELSFLLDIMSKKESES